MQAGEQLCLDLAAQGAGGRKILQQRIGPFRQYTEYIGRLLRDGPAGEAWREAHRVPVRREGDRALEDARILGVIRWGGMGDMDFQHVRRRQETPWAADEAGEGSFGEFGKFPRIGPRVGHPELAAALGDLETRLAGSDLEFDRKGAEALHLGKGLAHRRGGIHDQADEGDVRHVDCFAVKEAQGGLARGGLGGAHQGLVAGEGDAGVAVLEAVGVDARVPVKRSRIGAFAFGKDGQPADDAGGNGGFGHLCGRPVTNSHVCATAHHGVLIEKRQQRGSDDPFVRSHC